MTDERPKKPAGWYSKDQRAARAAAFAERKAAAAEKCAERERADAATPLRAQAARMLADASARLRDRHAAQPVPGFQTRMARISAARKRERQRVDHLVLGKPRPDPVLSRPDGMSRMEWKLEKARQREVGAKLIDPAIDEALARKEKWAHKRYGTPETWENEGKHTDSLHQLEVNGTLTSDQVEWAAQIANVYRSIESDVAVKIASFESRVDNSGRAAGLIAERIARVRMHFAYTIWRERLPAPKQATLDMIVGDRVGYTVAARRYHMHNRRARRLLIDAIDRWPSCVEHAHAVVDQEVYGAVSAGEGAATPEDRRTPMVVPLPAPPVVSDGESCNPTPEARPVDPRFLDDRGYLLAWNDIAAIIVEGMAA